MQDNINEKSDAIKNNDKKIENMPLDIASNEKAPLNQTANENDALENSMFSLSDTADFSYLDSLQNDNSNAEEEKSGDALKSNIEQSPLIDNEFLDIPEMYFEEKETNSSFEDENISINALLYEDDESDYKTSYDITEQISFADLRSDIEKILIEAQELRNTGNKQNKDSKIAKENAESDENAGIYPKKNAEKDDEELFIGELELSPKKDIANSTIESEPINKQKSLEIIDSADAIANEEKEKNKEPDQTNSQKENSQKEHIVTIDHSKLKRRKKEVENDRTIDSAFEIIAIFVFTIFAMLYISAFLFRHTVVVGDSMNNTLYDGDHLIISNLFYTPKRGDIVVFDEAGITDSEIYRINDPVIKRIIALGGDTIEIKGGCVYVNDNEITEEYKDIIKNQNLDKMTVPEGMVFIMGDNRDNSADSAKFGVVDENAIIGRVILRFYPFDSIDFFNGQGDK